MVTSINNECIAYKVRKVTRVITAIYNSYLKDVGINIMQFNLLHEIKDKAALNERHLGEYLYMNPTTISRNARLLSKSGYLGIIVQKDKRNRGYYLTKDGEEVIIKAFPFWQEAQKDVLFRMGTPPLFDIFKETKYEKS